MKIRKIRHAICIFVNKQLVQRVTNNKQVYELLTPWLLRHCPMPAWPPPPLFPFVVDCSSTVHSHNTRSRDKTNYDRARTNHRYMTIARHFSWHFRRYLCTTAHSITSRRDRNLLSMTTSCKLLVLRRDESERIRESSRGNFTRHPPRRYYTCCTGCTFAHLTRFM